jgi:hypothetical protein
MRSVLLIVAAVFAFQIAANGQKKTVKFDKLPDGISLKTEVRKDVLNAKKKVVSFEITTVAKRLDELKARYRKGVLVDGKGREIRFFEPFCRGVSAGAEQDAQDQKAKDRELADLKKKYTVIILYCDPRTAF